MDDDKRGHLIGILLSLAVPTAFGGMWYGANGAVSGLTIGVLWVLAVLLMDSGGGGGDDGGMGRPEDMYGE